MEYLPKVKLLLPNMSEGLAIKQGTAGIGGGSCQKVRGRLRRLVRFCLKSGGQRCWWPSGAEKCWDHGTLGPIGSYSYNRWATALESTPQLP